tara:strand:- start:4697 stop:5413 length:717 start_codon:yes stop_codon:yes gene_type:complete
MGRLILIRHGQSKWNAENKFTGWVDVDLSKNGELEAKKSGELIKNLNIKIDLSYTSFLKRAVRTLEIVSKIINAKNSFNTAWELNERHYGELTGLNKDETKKKLGEEKFKLYRRSWDVAPPEIKDNDENLKLFSPLNIGIPKDKIPKTESLKDTYNRVIPFYEKFIKKNLELEKNIIISAHGNSLRALCKYLFGISDVKINNLEIPTGNPLKVELNKDFSIKNYEYLDSSRKKEVLNI